MNHNLGNDPFPDIPDKQAFARVQPLNEGQVYPYVLLSWLVAGHERSRIREPQLGEIVDQFFGAAPGQHTNHRVVEELITRMLNGQCPDAAVYLDIDSARVRVRVPYGIQTLAAIYVLENPGSTHARELRLRVADLPDELVREPRYEGEAFDHVRLDELDPGERRVPGAALYVRMN